MTNVNDIKNDFDVLINAAQQIGQNAYDEVKNNWSLKSLGEKYETAIKELSNAEPNTVGHSEFN